MSFAQILAKAISSTESRNDKEAAVAVSLLGNVLKLSYQDTRKYAGLITSEPFAEIMRNFSVLLTARMLPADRQAKKVLTERFKRSEAEVPVRLLICGLMAEKDALGSLLSDHGLFFQHPFQGELDGSVPYINPHYLLRPGSRMPDLDRLSLSGSTDAAPAEVLDDVAKARLMRVFYLAYDLEASIEARPSPRLKSTLKRYRHYSCYVSRLSFNVAKRHQLSALVMMTEKECGIIENAEFPTLWEKSVKPNGDPW